MGCTICTSAAAKSAVTNIFHHLSELHPSHLSYVLIIPLGINVSDAILSLNLNLDRI